jgi:phage terminase large subunit-like protein
MKRLWIFALLVIALFASVAMYDDTRATRAVKFFNGLKHTKGRFYGQPFTLLPWQDRIVRDVYGTLNDKGIRQYKFVYIEVPKKNGKSEICAGAGLFHTFADGERNGEVYGCAAEREQASIIFDVAVDMIDQQPALKKRTKLQISKKTLTDKVSGTSYKALSSEAYSKHGLNLSACIFDELHAQPNRDLWDVMTFGAGDARRQPIWWIITTAGDDPDRVSIGWEQHDYAERILSGDITDPTWYPVIYNYDGEDIYNETNWATANPSLGYTIQIESVREAADKAKIKSADERLFRWLRLNQWVTTKLTTWLPLSLYDATVGTWARADLVGRDCYLGLDLSSTTDLTALCLVFPPQGKQRDWRVLWDVFIPFENMRDRIKNDKVPYDQWVAGGWITATEGDVIDYTKIKERIVELGELFNIKEACSDRAMATMLLQELEKLGFTCVDIPQTFEVETDPLNHIEVLLRTGHVTHEANPVARWCFGNASIAKNGSEKIKLVKQHRGKSVSRTKRIDPISAWMNATARARFYSGSADLSETILSEDWGM